MAFVNLKKRCIIILVEEKNLELPVNTEPLLEGEALYEEVEKLSKYLNESWTDPLILISAILQLLGKEKTWEFVAKAEEIEANGGMLTSDQTRRRTLGGVFFRTVRYSLPSKDRNYIFKRLVDPKKRVAETFYRSENTAKPRFNSPAVPNVMNWDDREELYPGLIEGTSLIGTASVKITIIGQPLKVIEKPTATLMTFRGGNAPALPKGLPTPPTTPTVYLVIVAAKQWKKVTSMTNPHTDKLVIEGWPVYDAKLGTITVLAQSLTSVQIQKQKQEEQRQKAQQKSDQDPPEDETK